MFGKTQTDPQHVLGNKLSINRTLARISKLGVQKYTFWGEFGVPILFRPIALYTTNMDIRVSKRHPDTPLVKGPSIKHFLVRTLHVRSYSNFSPGQPSQYLRIQWNSTTKHHKFLG